MPLHAEASVGQAVSMAAGARAVIRAGGDACSVLQAATKRAQGRSSAEAGLPITVLLFLGHARWSRTQLQNEVLRGDWG